MCLVVNSENIKIGDDINKIMMIVIYAMAVTADNKEMYRENNVDERGGDDGSAYPLYTRDLLMIIVQILGGIEKYVNL